MRKIVYTKALIDLIAGCIFDGLTDEETGILSKIPTRQISRLRLGEDCPEIRIATIERMRKYIALIRDGTDREGRWTRIAWFLERRYPDRWAKPEVLLNLNTGSNVTNNTLVITAEQAQGLKLRNVALDEQLSKLSPPSARAVMSDVITNDDARANSLEIKVGEGSCLDTPIVSEAGTLPNKEHEEKTLSSSVVLAPGATAPTGTPDAGLGKVEPFLPPKSKILKGNTTKKKSVKNSRNSDFIPPGGIVESPQSPESIASGEKDDIKRKQLLKSLEFSRKPARQPPPNKKRGTENVPRSPVTTSLPPAPGGPKSGRK